MDEDAVLDMAVLSLPRRRWEDNIKMDLREIGWLFLRIGTSGGLL
jgi:hypothetical protein